MKRGNKYIEAASKIGKSQHSPGKDRAKSFISTLATSAITGNIGYTVNSSLASSEKQRKQNAAAHQANILRNKNKTKERNAAKNKG